jgi:hypothetical protein
MGDETNVIEATILDSPLSFWSNDIPIRPIGLLDFENVVVVFFLSHNHSTKR